MPASRRDSRGVARSARCRRSSHRRYQPTGGGESRLSLDKAAVDRLRGHETLENFVKTQSLLRKLELRLMRDGSAKLRERAGPPTGAAAAPPGGGPKVQPARRKVVSAPVVEAPAAVSPVNQRTRSSPDLLDEAALADMSPHRSPAEPAQDSAASPVEADVVDAALFDDAATPEPPAAAVAKVRGRRRTLSARLGSRSRGVGRRPLVRTRQKRITCGVGRRASPSRSYAAEDVVSNAGTGLRARLAGAARVGETPRGGDGAPGPREAAVGLDDCAGQGFGRRPSAGARAEARRGPRAGPGARGGPDAPGGV